MKSLFTICPISSAYVLMAVLPAQTSSTSPAEGGEQSANGEETVVLFPFEVSSYQPARYQVDEAASGGRIRTNIMDTPTTVTVMTAEFMEDVGGVRVFDAAKYVAGISESTIPNSLDRINIRGFQTGGRRVDGFGTTDQANYDPAAIERMEVIKGPDALLSPAGTPGGTINMVSKRPQFRFGGSLSLQLGKYSSNRVEADVTGPLSERFAYRLVAAVQDHEGYVERSWRKSTLVSPSLTWRMAPQSNLTLRYEYYYFNASNLEGIITDPSVSTEGAFRTLEGLSLRFNPEPGREDAFSSVTAHTGTFLFTKLITDRVSVRLAGRLMERSSPDSSFRWVPVLPGGSRNPMTGAWDGGVIWSQTAPFVGSPAATGNVYQHQGIRVERLERARDLQNDWAYMIDGAAAKSTTMLGWAYMYDSSNAQSNTQTLPDFYLPGWSGPGAVVRHPINSDERESKSRYQAYLTQQLELWQRRIILSAGLAHVKFTGLSGDKLSAANPPDELAGQMFQGRGNKITYNYGLVVKPSANFSVYFGHSENAVPTSNYREVRRGNRPVFSEGRQDEVGLKFRFFSGRLLASVAYYEVEQTGYVVANPLNLTVPPPPVTLPGLVLSRKGSGYEFQVTGNLNADFSVILSYADTKNRDPNGIMLRGSAEDMGAAFLRYEFSRGGLKGLSIAAGANYMSKRAADQASGLAAGWHQSPTSLRLTCPPARWPICT